MLLWVIMAALAALASLSVLVPLYRGRGQRTAAGAPAASIYRDQLGEVDRDLDRGLIGETEADAARTEISRRLIRAGETSASEKAAAGDRPRRIAGLVALVAMPLLAVGLYVLLGSPGLPDQPLAARLSVPPEQQDLPTLVARIEAHLAAEPKDGEGWAVIGPVYVRQGRYADAVRAFANALDLLGENAALQADLGDAIVRLNEGVVTSDARAAFERANKLDPQAVRPRFYLALALTQDGKKAEALAAWRDLLKGAPASAPWVPIAERAMAKLEAPPDSATPGPTEADVEAAAGMTPEDRSAMIEGMVGQLAARLEAEPKDAEGWARLVRSYMVLGRADDARAALAKARTALAGEAARLATVDRAAKEAGLTE
jgi:cytochrome c-type biogenesis protein CcmH